MTGIAALEPQSGHLHNGTLNDRSRETTRVGEGQLSQERTQFPETSAKKTDGRLQPTRASGLNLDKSRAYFSATR